MITDYIGYWTLDEETGDVSDSSGNGHTGTNHSTTTIGGMVGQGRQFLSASSQYITMGNVVDFTTDNFTIAFWYQSSTGTGGYMIAKRAANSGAYVVYFNGGGNITLYLQTNDSNWKQTIDDGNTANSKWHHFVGIRSGASNPTLTIYIDGLIKSTTDQGSGVVGSVTNIGDLTLSSIFSTPGTLYDGNLDEVRIYNRAFDKSDVRQLYQFGSIKINSSKTRPRAFAPGLAR